MMHRCSERCKKRSGKPGCKWRFPKEPCDFTHYDEKGNLILKRRPSESNVVAYNKTLLLKFKSHVNVEYVGELAHPQYIMKYVNKTQDTVSNVRVQLDNSAALLIDQHFQSLYISSAQANWEMLGFDIYHKTVTVMTLAVHLQDQQWVDTETGEAASEIVSHLLRYFWRPTSQQSTQAGFGDFDSLLILNYFSEFAVQKVSANTGTVLYDNPPYPTFPFAVQKRKKRAIARFSDTNIFNAELNSLKVLLKHVPARSFADLKTFHGVAFETFRDAAIHLGLADVDEMLFALEQASQSRTCTHHRLRNLFLLAAQNGLEDVKGAFDRFSYSMFFDPENPNYVPPNPMPTEDKDFLLRQLRDQLLLYGSDLSDIDLQFCDQQNPLNTTQFEIAAIQTRLFDPREEGEKFSRQIHDLDASQREILDKFVTAQQNNDPIQLIVDAPAGYGKSFLAKTVSSYFRSKGLIAVCAAWQAVAARSYQGGKTIHSTFGFGIDRDEFVSKFEAQSLHYFFGINFYN